MSDEKKRKLKRVVCSRCKRLIDKNKGLNECEPCETVSYSEALHRGLILPRSKAARDAIKELLA